MITESQRNYEVSIWTLQDSFITVLKPTNLEFKGQIQDPDMVLKDDGTLNFSFSIPMYIRSFPIPYNEQASKGELVENPIWYNTRNGVIAASMRKLKVIFDKFNDPTIFEFLITKVTETHEKGQLICKVESESLAFHELGHQGVIINLSADDFTTEYNEWWENGHDPETEPKNNINYWTEKALRFTNWQYEVQMNYSGYIGRQSNIIYDDAYVADWKLSLDGNNLTSNRIEDAREKCRNISISDSNLYNINQKLAEEFEVYCKYKYEYDSSFHIIGRKIIYYNSFIQEQNGVYDITYPYDTDKITRTMDGTDICTKLYVKKVEDDTAPAGYISIMSTAANPSGEDYILNFDYLHKIGTITEEQYAEIKPYEIAMRKFNHELEELSTKMADAQLRLVEYNATISIATTSINQYDGQINDNLKLLKAITDDTGYIHLTQATAAHGTLVPDADFQDNFYKINISQKGVVHDAFVVHKVSEDSTETVDTDKAYIKIFAARDSIGDTTPYSGGSGDEGLEIKPDGLKLKDDGYGNIIGITGFAPSTEIKSYYLIFSYCPKLYYENIITKFETKKKAEEQVLSKAQQLKANTEKDYDNWKERYDALILEKEAAIRRFNILMGPALREGQWNPENYKDYGTKGEARVTTGGITDFSKPANTNDLVSFVWDDEPFEGEQKTYQLIGIDMGVENYPFIKLTNEDLIAMRDHDAFDKLCFFYNELGRDDTWCELRIGAQMKLAFKQFNENNSSKIQAVLLLTDLGVGNYESINALGDQWKILGLSKTEIVEDPTKPGILNSTIVTIRTGIMKTGPNQIVLELDNNYTNSTEELENGMFKRIFTNPLVYPRIKINSPSLKTTELKVSRSSDEFDFQIKYVHAYHTDEAVYLSVTLASDQDGNNIKILPTYIPYKANGTLDTDSAWYSGKDSGTINYENWSNWENGIVNRFLAFGNPYRRQRRSFLLDVSAFKVVNGTVQPTAIATHRITIDLSQDVDAEYTYSDDLKFNLDMYTDYSVLLREQAYYLTLKPEILLQYGADAFKVIYEISNADTNIYLDAREVSQTNAYPQASYEVAVSLFGRKIDFKTYNLIGQIVNINDLDLKFEHVQGYISEVDLKLDKPWEDSIKIQNYKNKFEDLFSTIIASSNIVQAKAAIYDRTVSLFNSDGTLKDEVIKTTLGKVNLQYAFNKGKLTISEENGIWAISEDGVVAMSGGGIFTATEKDSIGNWIWNTGIIPSGINASLINSGQLDTNLVRIFAGDNLRFQMNGDGLFAYRSRLDGSPILNQYVVHNSEGLFLRGPENQNEFSSTLINRVAVDWNGLTLKNWAGKTTLFADAEQGNLWLSGTVSAQSFKIVNTDTEWAGAQQGSSIDGYIASLLAERTSLLRSSMTYLFDQAGQVLQAAESSLSSLDAIHLTNNSLLNDFYNQVKEGLVEQREIKLYSNSSVDLLAGDTSSNVSAISISPSKGVWIGSSKGINFYAGGITDSTVASGASVSIDANKIIMGVSNVNSGTAIELTPSTIVFAAGTTAAQALINTSDTNIASSNLGGVKIDKDGIYFATGNGSDRSYIGMNTDGIQIGLVGGNYRGSYIKLSKDGLDVGSGADLHINTNNVQIFTDDSSGYFVLGDNLLNGGTRYLTLSSSGLSVTGNITANSLTITPGASIDHNLVVQNDLTPYAKKLLSSQDKISTDNNDDIVDNAMRVELSDEGLKILAVNRLTGFWARSDGFGFWHRATISNNDWIQDLAYSNGTLWIGATSSGWQITSDALIHIYNNVQVNPPEDTINGGIYLGPKGINVNNRIKMYSSGQFSIGDDNNNTYFNFSNIAGTDGYSLTLNNVKIDGNCSIDKNVLITSLENITLASPIHKTKVVPTTANMPAENGDICVRYSDTNETVTNSLNAINPVTNIPVWDTFKTNQDWYQLGTNVRWNGYKYNSVRVGNTDYDLYGNSATSNDRRVGVGETATANPCALYVPIHLTGSGTLYSFTVTFSFRTQPVTTSGTPWTPWDHGLKISNSFWVALGSGGNPKSFLSKKTVYSPVKDGYNNYISTKRTVTVTIELNNPITLTSAGTDYELIFFSNAVNSLVFIDATKIIINEQGNQGSEIIAELYIRSANTWVKVAP